MVNSDRIFVGDMFSMQASWKGRGLKAYYVEDGLLVPLTVSRCRNKWKAIFLLTDDEAAKASAVSDLVKSLLDVIEKQKQLVSELLASRINELINSK